MKPKQMIVAATLLVLSMFGTATAQEVNHRLLHANGQGTLKVGQEQFKVNGVVVKLLDDQKAEITLIADITIFISGTWSRNGEPARRSDLHKFRCGCAMACCASPDRLTTTTSSSIA